MKLDAIIRELIDALRVERWNENGLLRGLNEYDQKVMAKMLDNHVARILKEHNET